jgi:tetratricopeptide (TPR) repeat protein
MPGNNSHQNPLFPAPFQACVLIVAAGRCPAYMENEAAPLPMADQLWTWFETNKKQAFYGAIVLVAGGLIAGFVYWQQNEKEVAAGEALTNVSAPQMGSPGARPEAAEAYLKVAANYPKSGAAQRATLFAGTSYFLGGRYAEAKTQFDKFAREHRESSLLGEALLGSAACLDAEGKTDEAIIAYKNLVDHHPGESTIPEAKFALARLYEAQNKPEQARSLYEEIMKNDPFRSSIGDESAMRLEDLRIKYPPAPAAATPPPPVNLAPSAMTPRPSAQSVTNVISVKPATNAAPTVAPPSNAAPFKLQTR